MAAVQTQGIVTTGYPSCARDVTPHDDNDLTDYSGTPVAMFVRAEAAGDIAVIPSGNDVSDVVVFSLAAGEFVPCRVRRVLASGTNVGSITAVW